MSRPESWSAADRLMMERALQLARGGMFTTSPNPMVGAVITDADGNIIGEGWHRCFGEGHAEVNAVASVADPSRLRGATVYVTLEPCSHYGKTPPCARLLIEKGVGRVVAATADPNPRVSGRGFAMLREAGITVECGLLGEESRRLNEKFHTAHTTGRTFVTLKWAMSADRWLDRRRTAPGQPAARISTPLSGLEVMKLRATHDAILAGAGTVIADNPSLTVRGIAGRSPMRVVADRRQRVEASARVFADDGVRVVYLTSGAMRADLPAHVEQVVADNATDPAEIATVLHKRFGCNSLLVEGGAEMLRSFIDAGVFEAIRIEQSPEAFGDQGQAAAPTLPAGVVTERVEQIGENVITHCRKA